METLIDCFLENQILALCSLSKKYPFTSPPVHSISWTDVKVIEGIFRFDWTEGKV